MKTILIFLSLLSLVRGYKIVIFVPTLSNSQVIFNYQIAEVLTKAGHEVTLYRAQYNPEVTKGKVKLAKEYKMEFDGAEDYIKLHSEMQGDIFSSDSTGPPKRILDQWFGYFDRACKTQLQNKALIKMLSQHDLAITHMYDYCPFGLVKVAKIPTRIWMSSATLIDTMAILSGVPNPPSVVPNVMSSYSDTMTYMERVKNTLGLLALRAVIRYKVISPQTELFRQEFGAEFPDLGDLAGSSPLVFVNSEELIDIPRPILHKTVYIGGIGKQVVEPLDEEWGSLMENSQDGVVLVSFGSVANSSSMPAHWKKAFLETFPLFPTYTFIWKYETDDLVEAKSVKNLRLSKWVPQKDLLGHAKMRAFITHGGYNSFMESMVMGVPVVPVPLFGDQYGTAKRGERHGVAVTINKMTLSKDTITAALKTILNEPKYSENAKRLSSMIRKKPVKAEDLLVKWVEFVAEHKTLPNLAPTSNDLNFFQYFLIDVFGGILFVVLSLFYVVYKIIRLYIWWCCGTHKRKTE